MNSLHSDVHVSSSFESGALRIDCLALFANSPFSTFILSPMDSLHSAVHASSTNESGGLRIDCLALFPSSPFSTFIRSPMNLLPSAVHVSTFASGAPRSYCVLVHVSSTFEFGAMRSD